MYSLTNTPWFKKCTMNLEHRPSQLVERSGGNLTSRKRIDNELGSDYDSSKISQAFKIGWSHFFVKYSILSHLFVTEVSFAPVFWGASKGWNLSNIPNIHVIKIKASHPMSFFKRTAETPEVRGQQRKKNRGVYKKWISTFLCCGLWDATFSWPLFEFWKVWSISCQ